MDESIVPSESIEFNIHIIRNQRVILDQDLAAIYGVATKNLNKAVQRNIDRFPEDFAFRLNRKEWETLKSQIATSNLRFQFGTSSYGGRRYLPYVFTEHGTYAAAFVLRSTRAQKMSIEVIRAFIRMRKFLISNEALTKNVQELKSFALKHSHRTDQEFHRVWRAIEKLSTPPEEEHRIGFRLE